jgi:hypothetical protein
VIHIVLCLDRDFHEYFWKSFFKKWLSRRDLKKILLFFALNDITTKFDVSCPLLKTRYLIYPNIDQLAVNCQFNCLTAQTVAKKLRVCGYACTTRVPWGSFAICELIEEGSSRIALNHNWRILDFLLGKFLKQISPSILSALLRQKNIRELTQLNRGNNTRWVKKTDVETLKIHISREAVAQFNNNTTECSEQLKWLQTRTGNWYRLFISDMFRTYGNNGIFRQHRRD